MDNTNINEISHEFTIASSQDFWVQKTYEEIKKRTYLDPLYDAAFKAFLSDEERARREERRYEIPPTYAIWICDFSVEQQDNYRGTWAIRNEKGLTLTSKASMWPCLHGLLRAA